MSTFNLQKESEKVKFIVAKKGIPNVRAQVVTALDVSGSAKPLFESGAMQEAWQSVIPVSMQFDKNQEIDVYTFASGESMVTKIEPTATTQNFDGYISKNILRNNSVSKWGGTDYAPVIEAVLRDFGFYDVEKKEIKTSGGGFFGFGKKTTVEEIVSEKLRAKSVSGDPVILYFFTDGENSDRPATTQLLQACQDAKTELYINFIGIGSASSFGFIEDAADRFDNVGLWNVSSLSALTKDDVYEQLIPEELCRWFKVS